MPDSKALAQVASLLPEPHRENFLLMAARFKNVPEDDEYLQILEAIGFMTLLWKEVPNEIRKILEGTNPITETCQSLSNHVKVAVENAIPTHQDLRHITQSLEGHQIGLKQGIASMKESSPKVSHSWLVVILAFLLGIAACFIGLQQSNFLTETSLWKIIQGCIL